jgi:hypothetical protein
MRSKGLGFRLRRWLGRGTPHSRRTGAGNAIALGEGVFRVTAVPAEEGNSVSEALEWRRWNGSRMQEKNGTRCSVRAETGYLGHIEGKNVMST